MSSNVPLDSSGLGLAEKVTLDFRNDQSFLKTSEQINNLLKQRKKTICDISDVLGNILSLMPLSNYSPIQSLDSDHG